MSIKKSFLLGVLLAAFAINASADENLKTVCPILVKQATETYQVDKAAHDRKLKERSKALGPVIASVRRFTRNLDKEDRTLMQLIEKSKSTYMVATLRALRRKLEKNTNCGPGVNRGADGYSIICGEYGGSVLTIESLAVPGGSGEYFILEVILQVPSWGGMKRDIVLGHGDEDLQLDDFLTPFMKTFPDKKTYMVESLNVPAACFADKVRPVASYTVDNSPTGLKGIAIGEPAGFSTGHGSIVSKNVAL